MPAAKSHRVHLRRTARNRSVKSYIRSRTGVARRAIDADPGADATDGSVREAARALDVAVRKGVIHRNQAARKKSRLMLRHNKARANASASSD